MIDKFFSSLLVVVGGLWAFFIILAILFSDSSDLGIVGLIFMMALTFLPLMGLTIFAARIRGATWMRALGQSILILVGVVVVIIVLLFWAQKDLERQEAANRFDSERCLTEFGKQPHTQWYLN